MARLTFDLVVYPLDALFVYILIISPSTPSFTLDFELDLSVRTSACPSVCTCLYLCVCLPLCNLTLLTSTAAMTRTRIGLLLSTWDDRIWYYGQIYVHQPIEPCVDVMVSATARRTILAGGSGAPPVPKNRRRRGVAWAEKEFFQRVPKNFVLS